MPIAKVENDIAVLYENEWRICEEILTEMK